MAKPVKLKLNAPGKEPWWRSMLIKVGLAKPKAKPRGASADSLLASAAAAADSSPRQPKEPGPAAAAAPEARASAGQPDVAAAPQAPTPPVPSAAGPGEAVRPPVTPAPGVAPLAASAAAPEPAGTAKAKAPAASTEAEVTRTVPAAPVAAAATGAAASGAAGPSDATRAAPSKPATPAEHEIVEGFDDDAEARAAATAAAAAAGRRRGKAPKAPKAPRVKRLKRPAKVKSDKPSAVQRKLRKQKPAEGEKRPGVIATVKAAMKDPDRRVRLLIWAGAGVLAVFIVTAVALGVTSTYWFCANGCHKVQDDTIIAYNRSAHNKISCMACHMPVGASPVTFMIHKVEALGELYQTVSNTYELPLNAESEVAKEMPETQCTQCHTDTRAITPSRGIIIDHAVHKKNGVECTTCHNRVAHVEDFKLTLAGNHKHEDWMSMEACFRCHSLDPKSAGFEGKKAPGACTVCHPADFPLKPQNHRIENFERTHPTVLRARGNGNVGAGKQYCSMCHNEKTFCDECHGTEIPHPKDFKAKHGKEFKAIEKKNPGHVKLCLQCHGNPNLPNNADFCNNCHHKGANPNRPWIPQHPEQVKKQGTVSCISDCHDPTFCAKCHTRLNTAN